VLPGQGEVKRELWTGMEVWVQLNACIVQQHHVEVRLSSHLFLDRHSRSTEVCFLVANKNEEQTVLILSIWKR